MPSLAELFAGHTPSDWIMIIFSIFYLYPIWLSFKNYQRTGSRDYLIFAGVFIGQAFHWNLFPLARNNSIAFLEWVNSIAFLGWMFLLFLHALRLRWEERPRILWWIGAGLFVTMLIYLPLQLFSYLPVIFSKYLIGGILIELYRLYMGGLLIYAYVTVKPDYSDQRIKTVRGIWLFRGSFEIVLGLGFQFFYFQGIWGVSLPPSWIMIVSIFSSLSALIFFLLGALFPEAMLISHALIMRATKLYELVEQAQELDPTQSRDYLLRYVQNLPPEVLQELEPSIST